MNASSLISLLHPISYPSFSRGILETPLTGDTAVISCHFNPCGYQTQTRNLAYFLEFMAETSPPLFMAELTFSPRQLLPSNNRVLHLEAKAPLLWQKESLLNAVEKIVPPQFTKIIWIDADCLMTDPAWLENASRALDEYAIIQPFKRCVFTDEKLDESGVRAGCGYAATTGNPRKADWSLFHCGFAWGARRELWTEHGGLIECLSGQADSLIALAAMGQLDRSHSHGSRLNDAMWKHVSEWAAPVTEWTGGKIGSIPGDIVHLWHGNTERRRYRDRQSLLRDLDPARHLYHTDQGLLAWTQDAHAEIPETIEALTNYFSERAEDTP